jgi:hypothetical protein
VVVPQEGRDDSLANILNMLNRRLYQLEHEQPITPLGAAEGEGADTRLLWCAPYCLTNCHSLTCHYSKLHIFLCTCRWLTRDAGNLGLEK